MEEYKHILPMSMFKLSALSEISRPWYNWHIVESGVKHHNPNPEM